MKRHLFSLALTAVATTLNAQNPIVQTWFTSDPAPMVHNDTLYVYTGHDEDNADGIMKLVAAGGFKDITRISSSSPDIWQQICLTNKTNILTLLDHYVSSLETIRDEISRTEEKRIHEFFEKARAYRESFTNSNAGPIKTEYVITVDIADKPGAIATIASILSGESINIKNIGINHNREFQQGALRIEFYRKEDTEAAIRVMTKHGYVIHSKDNA